MDKKSLISRTGDTYQYAGIMPFIYDDGKGKGVSAFRVKTGKGLEFTVLRDRALDIFECTYRGVNVSFMSRNGLVAPEYFADNFSKTFSGGLFFTAGLHNTGKSAPGFPTHGRIHSSPASNSYAKTFFEDGVMKMEIGGTVPDSSLSDSLFLHREYRIEAGKNEICLFDTVTNMNAKETDTAILYHINFGFPFIDESAKLAISEPFTVSPFDAESQKEQSSHLVFDAPRNVPSLNYLLDISPRDDGFAAVRVESPSNKFGIYIRAKKDTLPYFNEWKSLTPGVYTLAVEPCDNTLRGITEERENGTMKKLAPFEERDYKVIFGFYDL